MVSIIPEHNWPFDDAEDCALAQRLLEEFCQSDQELSFEPLPSDFEYIVDMVKTIRKFGWKSATEIRQREADLRAENFELGQDLGRKVEEIEELEEELAEEKANTKKMGDWGTIWGAPTSRTTPKIVTTPNTGAIYINTPSASSGASLAKEISNTLFPKIGVSRGGIYYGTLKDVNWSISTDERTEITAPKKAQRHVPEAVRIVADKKAKSNAYRIQKAGESLSRKNNRRA